MDLRQIHRVDPEYPPSLRAELDADALPSFATIGNTDILSANSIGLICSIKCPGAIIIKTYDAIREIRDEGLTVVGGFHSPMEKECLAILLRGKQPTIICPARSLDGMRIPKEWQKPIDDGRLLIASPFAASRRRATADLAVVRNNFVAALASFVLIAHASPGGKVMALATRLVNQGKPIFTISDPENASLLELGAKPHGLLLRRTANLDGS